MEHELLPRVLTWLQRGYPDGVPSGDYPALIAVLHERLTEAELRDITTDLALLGNDLRATEAQARIDAIIAAERQTGCDDDAIRQVSARLAAGGWPLAELHRAEAGPFEEKDGALTRIVAWLKKGYPTGVPTQDYIPIIAILRRRLSDDDIEHVVDTLVADGTIRPDREDIGAAILKVTDVMPTEQDFARVQERLGTIEPD